MKGQRSPNFCTYCQLGLELVTLILSSVVNPNTNPDPNPKRTFSKNGCDDSGAVRINTDDYGALFETCLGNRFHVVLVFFSGTFERRHGIFHAHEKKHDPAFSPC